MPVQFNRLKLPGLIPGGIPVCLEGLVFLMYVTSLQLTARFIIGLLVVVAAIAGLEMEMPVALLLMPCLYVFAAGKGLVVAGSLLFNIQKS
ncbi:MAG: hypothetical protein R6U27_04340 [Desulfobacterales bacterium]